MCLFCVQYDWTSRAAKCLAALKPIKMKNALYYNLKKCQTKFFSLLQAPVSYGFSITQVYFLSWTPLEVALPSVEYSLSLLESNIPHLYTPPDICHCIWSQTHARLTEKILILSSGQNPPEFKVLQHKNLVWFLGWLLMSSENFQVCFCNRDQHYKCCVYDTICSLSHQPSSIWLYYRAIRFVFSFFKYRGFQPPNVHLIDLLHCSH